MEVTESMRVLYAPTAGKNTTDWIERMNVNDWVAGRQNGKTTTTDHDERTTRETILQSEFA